MMDPLYVTYLEETEELLQKAEECLIGLETGCSSDGIHALFRIFHSIKGSSQMIGYGDIGNLTHKLEDMLDIVRKGRIDLDGQILQLCFSGLDHVKQLFESKKKMNGDGNNEDFLHAVERLEENIDNILKANAEKESGRNNTSQGNRVVSAVKGMKGTGKNRYCIWISFSDDVPMISPVLFMILNNVQAVGSLVYTNISDEDIYAAAADPNTSSLSMILDTDLEEAELYTYVDVMYVEKVAIANISEHQMLEQAVPYDQGSRAFFETFFREFPKLYPILLHHPNTVHTAEFTAFIHEQQNKMLEAANRIQFHAMGQRLKQEIETFYNLLLNAADGTREPDEKLVKTLCQNCLEMFETVYGYARGKFFYKIFKVKNGRFTEELNGFVERMDKSHTRKFFLDLSRLETIHEHDLRSLIELKRRLQGMGIVMSIIVDNPLRRRLLNIFDSIRTVEPFELFNTEMDAALADHLSSAGNDKGCMEDCEMRGYSIMILDGDKAIADHLQQSLALAGYRQVETCSEPVNALDMLQKKKYHIVLADIAMPELGGTEFLKKIREYDPLTQVIIMTSHSSLDTILTCLELGANDYIAKPFQSNEAILEVVDGSIKKLERWREAIKGTIAAS
jgi:two-component system chemotaxis sensor kinase CheA